MPHTKFIGTGVAVITPFDNQEIDYPAFEKIINHVINGGVNYLVVLGSTGETAMLNAREARNVISFAIKVVNKRVPIVIGNFAGNNTAELVRQIRDFDFKGIDAILSSSPAYVKPSQQGIYEHFMAIEKASPVPIILYNVPGRTSSNMEWKTTVRLANASTKFIGIKEASGDLIQTTRIIKNAPENFFVTSGDDEVAVPMMSVGGVGCISVIANAFPTRFSGMINAALKEDYVEARRLNNQIYDMHHWLYIEGNPVGIKSTMKALGFCTNEVRMPLVPMSDDNYTKLVDALENHGLLKA